MEPVTNKLRRTRLFAGLPDAGLAELIASPGLSTGGLGHIVEARPGDIVVLLEGGLHMTAQDGQGEHLAVLSVTEAAPEPAVLYTIPHGATLRLTRDSVFLVIAGERLDHLVSTAQEQRSLEALDDATRARVAALIRSGQFKSLTFDRVIQCAEAMRSWSVSAGEDIVVEGEQGSDFYVIEVGMAEVIRGVRDGGERRETLARLSSGASFGEEALLQNAPRNATVRMVTDGRLLRLAKDDFNTLLRSVLVSELTHDAAIRMIDREHVVIIDCRTEAEWDLWRLPNARLIPLESIRDRGRGLDATKAYLVYCRSGRRSRAAAFLLRQMGLEVYSLAGGITGWPYEVEGQALGEH